MASLASIQLDIYIYSDPASSACDLTQLRKVVIVGAAPSSAKNKYAKSKVNIRNYLSCALPSFFLAAFWRFFVADFFAAFFAPFLAAFLGFLATVFLAAFLACFVAFFKAAPKIATKTLEDDRPRP